MADMTFKTNLLPKVATGETQSTYSLGSSTQRWKIYGSMPNTMRYATCSTAADTAAKEATIADGGPSFELVTGSVVFVKFTNSNNVANPTLNIGSTGAKSIICYGTTAPTTGVDTSWYAGAIITCIYDGTNWCLADFSSRGSDASNFMVKGTDYVTAGQKSGTTLGTGATAEGTGTTASAQRAHAEGWNTTASAIAAHAEGQATHATGQYSHAEGRMTSADEAGAHAEGMLSSATGQYSHAEGQISSASGQASHAEGAASAGGDYAHAEGNSHADGQYSHADGCGTSAQRKSQHTFGEYNVADTTGADGTEHGEYIEIVGNGTADDARSNARTLDWNGNETLAGKLTVGAAPTASMDVATKQYVDNAVTDTKVTSTAVTTATTNYIVGSTSSSTSTGELSKHASALIYTSANTAKNGYTQLRLGNATATSTAGGKEGCIRLYGTSTHYLDLKAGAITSSNKTITFPDQTGTVFLQQNIIRSTADPTDASSYPVGTIWIKYGADPMATMGDYITDTGTSGIWTYRKWNSGIAECWGLAEISGLSWVDYTTGGTPTCFNSPAAQVPMPASLFISITSINANTVSAGSNVGWVANTTFSNNNVQLIFVRNGTAGVVRAYIDIKGRWKE